MVLEDLDLHQSPYYECNRHLHSAVGSVIIIVNSFIKDAVGLLTKCHITFYNIKIYTAIVMYVKIKKMVVI